jgi:hypothetical protein
MGKFSDFFSGPMAKKMKALGGKVNNQGDGILLFDGKPVSLEYFSGSRYQPSYFKISVPGNFGGRLVIRRETIKDKLSKDIGLDQEVQVQDKEVDQKLFFECDTPEFVKQLFSDFEAKHIALDSLRYFTSIDITPHRCAFTRIPGQYPTHIGNDIILNAGPKLLSFVKFIPKSSSPARPEISNFKKQSALLDRIGYGALICGFAVLFWAVYCFRVFDDAKLWHSSLPFSIGLFIAGVIFAFERIRGFSTSSKVLLDFMFRFAIGAVLLGRFGGAVANGLFEQSQVSTFQQRVIDKYISHGKSTSYRVIVAPWAGHFRSWGFSVNPDEYNNVKIGSTQYMITTKPGRFGFEWVVSEDMIQ